MCIAIYVKKGSKIPTKEVLNECYINNSDGAGLAYVEKGEMVIEKGFFDFEEFYKRVMDIKNPELKSIFLHFRIGTGGGINKENTHPFRINKNICMMHNGILPIDSSQTKCDTNILATLLNRMRMRDLYKNKDLLKTLYELCGDYSKLIFMDLTEDVFFVNKDLGVWVDGVWFSNETYKKKVQYKTYKHDPWHTNGELCEFCYNNKATITTVDGSRVCKTCEDIYYGYDKKTGEDTKFGY